MTKSRQGKVNDRLNLLIHGYMKETFNKYSPDIILYTILLFYNSKNTNPFNVYNQRYKKINGNINNIIEVYTIGSSQYYITNDNSVYINGKNWRGRFGIGNKKLNQTVLFEKHAFFVDINIELISQSRSSSHVIIYTNHGKLYGSGDNSNSQILFDPNKANIYEPILVPGELPFKSALIQIETGAYHTIFLTETGHVYGCGSNSHNQLSFDTKTMIKKITLMDKFNDVVSIRACKNASFILERNGNMYSCGMNFYGCLGVLKNDDLKIVNKIDINDPIILIHCGIGHVSCITNKYELYLFGWNQHYQCGYPINVTSVKTPRKLEFNHDIINIKCGGNHNIIETEGNELYAFGQNEDAQCLQITYESHISTPRHISIQHIKSKINNNNTIIDYIPTLYETFILQRL